MKILTVSDVSMFPVIGGAERVLHEQCIRLARMGHSVHVLTRRLPEHRSFRECIRGVEEWRFPLKTADPFSFFLSSFFNSLRLFRSLEKKYGFDCIHFHQPLSAMGVLPLSRKIRKIYTCHSLSFEEYRSRNAIPGHPLGKILYRLHIGLRRQMEKYALCASDRILVLSSYTGDKLIKNYGISGKKIIIVPGGADLEKFRPGNDKAELRKRFQLPEKAFIVLTVRNLVPRMGLENLIRSIRMIADTAPEIFFVIGGEGPLKNDLENLSRESGIADTVRFTGFIAEKDLPDYYRMADLFVLPSRDLEGFGLVSLEALASGTPVLGTPVGGTKEILGRLDPSMLLKDTKAASLVMPVLDRYRMFRGNTPAWQALSRRCRRFAEENYSWEKNVWELEKILKG